jgi:hypothetical protein
MRRSNVADAANLSNADRQLAPAVAATLGALNLADVDTAAAKLAETYARAIDQAKAVESWADAVLRKVDHDSDLYDEVRALKLKLLAKVALADLGPKLAAVLVELGATPKARAAMAKGKAAGQPTGAGTAFARLQSVAPGA